MFLVHVCNTHTHVYIAHGYTHIHVYSVQAAVITFLHLCSNFIFFIYTACLNNVFYLYCNYIESGRDRVIFRKALLSSSQSEKIAFIFQWSNSDPFRFVQDRSLMNTFCELPPWPLTSWLNRERLLVTMNNSLPTISPFLCLRTFEKLVKNTILATISHI